MTIQTPNPVQTIKLALEIGAKHIGGSYDCEYIADALAALETLSRRLQVMEGALRFYADTQNWNGDVCDYPDGRSVGIPAPIEEDCGAKARAALSETEKRDE